MAKNLTLDIIAELSCILELVGITDYDFDLTDTFQVNRLLERRGADIYLLCTIGSWRDTMSDEEVLRDLREWLRGGEQALRVDPSFGSVREP